VLQGFVAFLVTLDTVHMILCTYSVYWYLILSFGNVESLDSSMWSINIQIDVNGLVGVLVQLYYARRLYRMSNNIILPVIIAALGTLTFSLGIVYTVKAMELKRFSRYDSLIWVTCVGIGSTCLADILIAVSMCWCLYHKRTGFKKTDSTIMTLILYSINTGLLTSVLAIGTLVFVRRPFISLTFFLALGRCYVNSLFAMLNNRNTLRGRSTNDSSGGSFAMSSIRQSKYPRSPTGPTNVAVTVHKTATTDFARCKYGYGSKPSAEESEKSEGIATSFAHEGLSETIV